MTAGAGRRFVVAPTGHTSLMASKEKKAVEAEQEKLEPVDDPACQRDDDASKERSTSPVPRVGDTWEDMTDVGTTGPQRRVGVLEVDGDQAQVMNKVTRRQSRIALDAFAPPKWRFIG